MMLMKEVSGIKTPERQRKLSDNDMEPLERKILPWFKDPSIKVSIWPVIKGSVGKDLSKIRIPVVFNDPTGLLQKCCQQMEYNHILDEASKVKDPALRLAYVAVYGAARFTSLERNSAKPFNPLCGETYEYITEDFEFLAE